MVKFEDFKNYDPNNRSEDKVFSSNYFSNYKSGVISISSPSFHGFTSTVALMFCRP